MLKVKIALLSAMVVLLSGCGGGGGPATPIKDEQTRGVYKIYYPNYFMYDKKMLDALLDAWCENSTCKQNYKNKVDRVTYVHLAGGTKCKTLDSVLSENEAEAILKLEQQKNENCIFRDNELMHDIYYGNGFALVGFKRDKNGDFINSEFLTLQDGKVVSRKLIEKTKMTTLYNKNGDKLLDKAHQSIYFYPKTCNKVLAVDGLKYEVLPIKGGSNGKKESLTSISEKSLNSKDNTAAANKEAEKLLKTKFYLDNKNFSKLQIFAPFGYIMEYGVNLVGKSKRKINIYRLFDKDGEDVFGDVDLTGVIRINDHRIIAQLIKPSTGKSEAFLYDFDNKKVLLRADWIKPDNSFSAKDRYDMLVFLKDGKRGMADFDGNIIIDLQSKYYFERAYRGLFIIDTKGSGLYKKVLLDTQLNPIIEDVFYVNFNDDFFIVYLKDRLVIFDYAKNILQDLKANDISASESYYATSLKNSEYTLYDKRWNKIFDKTYKNLNVLEKGIFSHQINGKTALIDASAKEIIPPVCDSISLNQCGVIECYTE
ncbi:MAG: hypothetical protein LBQ18_04885 [Campylobacteraceae bacterium]|jgi:hypothetical protein|nr:hypothetical protein [Campylobacteraceae bacterium]